MPVIAATRCAAVCVLGVVRCGIVAVAALLFLGHLAIWWMEIDTPRGRDTYTIHNANVEAGRIHKIQSGHTFKERTPKTGPVPHN